MSGIFHTIVSQPLFNALVALYKYVALEDLGVAIILLTIVVRIILYPLSYKAFRNQLIMQKIQPEIQKIQHDHKDNKEKQAQLMIELWKTHQVNPFSSIILLFIQLPILIALYRIFLQGFSPEAFQNLYSFLSAPAAIHDSFLGLINLKEKSILVVGLAAVLQYWHGIMMVPKRADKTKPKTPGRSMVYIGPAITVAFLSVLPSAVGLYWATTSAFSVFQQWLINRSLKDYREQYGKNPGNSGADDKTPRA